MGRHVVGAFRAVAVAGRVVRGEARDPVLEIGEHVGVGVLLDEQARRRMAAPEREQAGCNPLLGHPPHHRAGYGDEGRTRRLDRDDVCYLAHGFSLVLWHRDFGRKRA